MGNQKKQRDHVRISKLLFALLTGASLSVLAWAAPSQEAGRAALPAATGFEVASVRMVPEADAGYTSISPPGAGLFTMHNVTLQLAIGWAFDVESDRVLNGPDWIDRQRYDISARPEGDTGLTYAQLRPLLQRLLRQRFHLTCHPVIKNFKGYALVVSSGGARLTSTRGGARYGQLLVDRIDARNVPVSFIAAMLGRPLREPVEDKTGLKGNYDFHIQFAPFDQPDSSLPSLFTAVEQLGLKLERQNDVPEDTLVIDHVDRVPTPN